MLFYMRSEKTKKKKTILVGSIRLKPVYFSRKRKVDYSNLD